MVHALEESIRKALVLIDYAAERGISIDNRVLTAIVGAAHNTNSMPVDIEIDFWNAYQKLSVTLAPATVDSILSTRSDPELDKQKNIFRRLFAAHYSSSLAERTTAIYRTFTFITLLLLLIAQVIWVAGVTITKDVEDLTRQFTVLSQNKIKIAHEAVEEQTIIDPSVAYSSPLGVIISDIKQLGRRLDAAKFTLQGWNRRWEMFMFFIKPPFEYDQDPGLHHEQKIRIELSSAKMLLEVLYKYALPWLFGLLGSCAYVLRRLENDLKSGSFSSKSPTFYSLRLVLGPLAGIAIGLLFVPSAQNAVFDTTNILDLAALSPLAVAFVAGYSVELIFSILDRIVNAFIKS